MIRHAYVLVGLAASAGTERPPRNLHNIAIKPARQIATIAFYLWE